MRLQAEGAGRRLQVSCIGLVFVATNRIFALVVASQIASASAESFFCRLT
jgi:hypothetical protein